MATNLAPARNLALLLVSLTLACSAGELVPGDEPSPRSPASGLPPADPSRVVLADSFDGGLAGWTQHVAAPNTVATVEGGYQGGKRLLLGYKNAGDHVLAQRGLQPVQDVLARVYFFDTMEPGLGTLFGVFDESEAGQTGLGIVPQVSKTSYSIRINSAADMRDTGIRRTAGWHLFELIVTPQGTYGKIDNRMVAHANAGHRSLSRIKLVATWGGTGSAYYDDLLVVTADRRGWRDQLLSPLLAHYRRYATPPAAGGPFVFSPLYTRNPLGSGIHSNDLRSVMDSAIAWYLLGTRQNDATAKQRAVEVFRDGWSNAPWKRGQDVNDWARGVVMLQVTLAAHLLWPSLDPALRAEIGPIIQKQVRTYQNRDPESGHVNDTKAEENAWHAAFLAAAVNLFPTALGADRSWAEPKARCFGYHTFTRSKDAPYCGLATQTVHDDWRLENHDRESPIYIAGALHLLAAAALSYLTAGSSIPWELTHNVREMYEKYLGYVDGDTFQYRGVPADWDGCHNTAYIGPDLIRFVERLGLPAGVDLQHFVSRRSLFCYDMASSWQDKPPESISIPSWNQADPATDSYKFFLDSVNAGEFYPTALLEPSPGCPADGAVISLRSRLNGLYVAAHNYPSQPDSWFLRAEGQSLGIEDRYRLQRNGDGTLSLRSQHNGLLVAAGAWNDWRLRAEGSQLGPEDKYHCAARPDGTISLRSALNGLLVAAGSWNDWRLRAEGSQLGPEDLYEVFILER